MLGGELIYSKVKAFEPKRKVLHRFSGAITATSTFIIKFEAISE